MMSTRPPGCSLPKRGLTLNPLVVTSPPAPTSFFIAATICCIRLAFSALAAAAVVRSVVRPRVIWARSGFTRAVASASTRMVLRVTAPEAGAGACAAAPAGRTSHSKARARAIGFIVAATYRASDQSGGGSAQHFHATRGIDLVVQSRYMQASDREFRLTW